MEKWQGKVAIVTGANAGIGAATAKALVQAGMKVVGFDRRKERIEQLAKELGDQAGKLYAVKVDLKEEQEILNGFQWTTDNVGPVSVLINNAGVVQKTTLHDGDTQMWRTVLDTNVLAVAIAAREAIRIMKENNIDGYIINVNSVAGHFVLDTPGVNMYSPSKYALTSMTETLRFELARLKSNIRVTSLSPGTVKTEIAVANNIVSEELYQQMIQNPEIQFLESEDVANAVLYLLGTPLRVQVSELTIRPIRETNSF
ncbi:dehydrogenase/reductase sdr family member 11 [Holotrichia oblita]|uniref:Dehydrogenase/reductase sdr family member 11 n=1 Tax=Holotrichia oblita TaxID=644536 RepID=A0ACB9SYP8_HOLOL|nr:dehydrogenase/reductase sdr family member 11 [Holotrichia oblita]